LSARLFFKSITAGWLQQHPNKKWIGRYTYQKPPDEPAYIKTIAATHITTTQPGVQNLFPLFKKIGDLLFFTLVSAAGYYVSYSKTLLWFFLILPAERKFIFGKS
jgi:hypothetical protein